MVGLPWPIIPDTSVASTSCLHIIFVYIDDWLETTKRNSQTQRAGKKASISELLTIAVVGELLAQPFNTWYWVVTLGTFSETCPVQPLPPGAQSRAAAGGTGALGYQQRSSAAP